MTTENTTTEERVLCVPRVLFDQHEAFEGFRPLAGRPDLGTYLQGAPQVNALYIKRSEAETNPNLKQLIPYIAIMAGSSILVYERASSGGEERLHAKLSIGVGGHVNTDDDPEEPFFTFANGAIRELREEVGLTLTHDALQGSVVGLVNEDQSDVGKVHLGVCVLIHVAETMQDDILAKCEHTLANPRFIPLVDLETREAVEALEPWSQFFAAHIIADTSTRGKWNDAGFRERVGLLSVTASNLASAATGLLLDDSPRAYMLGKERVEQGAGEVQVMLAGLIANDDIEGHLVKKAGKAFHEALPAVMRHQS